MTFGWVFTDGRRSQPPSRTSSWVTLSLTTSECRFGASSLSTSERRRSKADAVFVLERAPRSGDMVVTNHRTGETCTLSFKPRGWRAKDSAEVKGVVQSANGRVEWDIAGRELLLLSSSCSRDEDQSLTIPVFSFLRCRLDLPTRRSQVWSRIWSPRSGRRPPDDN